MSLFKLNILMTLITACFLSCNKSSSTEAKDTEYIMPLNNENKWVYVDSSFAIQNSFKPKKSTKVSKNTDYQDTSYTFVDHSQKILFEGKEIDVFAINWSSGDFSSIGESLWLEKNTDKGLEVYGFKQDDKDTLVHSIDIKFPVTVGEKWVRKYAYYYENKWEVYFDTVTCISKNEKIKTPIGTFEAFAYKSGSDDESIEYYVPGIGTVMYTFSNFNQLTLKGTIISNTVNN